MPANRCCQQTLRYDARGGSYRMVQPRSAGAIRRHGVRVRARSGRPFPAKPRVRRRQATNPFQRVRRKKITEFRIWKIEERLHLSEMELPNSDNPPGRLSADRTVPSPSRSDSSRVVVDGSQPTCARTCASSNGGRSARPKRRETRRNRHKTDRCRMVR